MPVLKKKSSSRKRLDDQLRKRLARNVQPKDNGSTMEQISGDSASTSKLSCHTTSNASSHPITTSVEQTEHNLPSDVHAAKNPHMDEDQLRVHENNPQNGMPSEYSQAEMCVGVHEHSFTGINIDDVLRGEIDIQIMDYTCQLLNVHYQCQYGMLPPSYLYSLVVDGQEIPMKIPKNVKAVQMHYTTGHYVLSARKNENIVVFDSLPSQSHLQEVIPQLKLLYENFDINDIQYTTPQHQGATTLCGIFVVANATFLLNNIDPHKCTLNLARMRTHFHQCLIKGEVTVFPTTEYSPLLSSYFKDQMNRLQNSQQTSDLQVTHQNNTHKTSKAKMRQDPEYRQHENNLRKKRRADETYRSRENEMRREKKKDESYRNAENEKRSEKRKDERYRNAENEKRTKTRSEKRKDESYRIAESEKRTKTRSEKRKDESYRNAESDKRSEKRKDERYRNAETEKRTKTRSEKRKDESYRIAESEKRTKTRSEKRKDESYRNAESDKRSEKRKDERYRNAETEKRTKTRSEKRKDESYRIAESEKRTKTRSEKRKDESYRIAESEKRTKTRSEKRKDESYRIAESEKRTKTRSEKRKDESYRNAESDKRSEKRKDERYRNAETEKRTKTRSEKRKDDEYRNEENETKRQKRRERCMDKDMLIEKFHKTVRCGPVNVCHMCKQLWYRHSVCKTTSSFKGKSVMEMINEIMKKSNTFYDNGNTVVPSESWICNTCLSYLKKSKVPPSSFINKMTFPTQGPLKDLNVLEQLLIAPVLPFLRLHQAHVGKQFLINGNIVLVPSDVINTVTSLPRLPSNTGTVKATLKRRLRYRHHVYRMNIRPEKVRESIAFLNRTSKLFQEHNILLDENFDEIDVIFKENDKAEQDQDDDNIGNEMDIHNKNAGVPENMVSEENVVTDNNTSIDEQTQETEIGNVQPKQTNDEDSDAWSELDPSDEETESPGIQDTMLSSPDFVEPSEKDFIFNFAPGEGRVPVSVFLQPNAEELSFPSIFCGQARPSKKERLVPVSYSEVVRSELRNQDRRAALSIENLFFKTKKLQMKQIIDQTQIAIRKSKTKGQNITAKDVRGDCAKHFIYQDKAFKFMAGIRGSPSYFQAVSKDLFAMIRQLGPATFFCSLSAAETRWTHLLCILSQIVDNTSCTEEEAANFDWQTKCRLIQSDPVLCARHFDYAVNKVIKEFMLDNSNPIGSITDFFYRVEYQQRGSPHIHMLIWCEQTPVYGEDSTEDIINFIDSYLTCEQPPETEPVLRELVKLQTHRHSHTCRKKSKKVCRFGFPKPPMDETCILEPVSSADSNKAVHLATWKKVQEHLNVLYDVNETLTFQDFLQSLSLTKADYILAVSASINTTTVFLKREISECRINSYNPDILRAWRANIDLQFVIDVYACASYIAAYVTKSHRGMSELLRNAAAEARKGNLEVRQQVRAIGNKFLNAVEISAQEAVYICLGLPMRKSSRQVVFINTSPPEERVSLLKPAQELEKLDDDSKDIECSNMLTRYAKRPKNMENITLANFAANYTTRKFNMKRRNVLSELTTEGLLPEQTVSDNEDDLTEPEVEDNHKYRKVKVTRIIRYVHYNPDTDEEKFCREQIMLFCPWRNEQQDLIAEYTSYKERYENIKEELETERLQYEPFREQVDEAEKHLNEETDMQDIWDTVAPVTEDTDGLPDQSVPPPVSAEEQYDIGPDLGIPASTCSREEIHKTYELPDTEYRQHMRSLNKEQMEFLYDTIHQLKTSDKPVYRFLSGGAGCGKTHLSKALYQMAVKYYNSISGKDFSTSPVLLMAPTGKAAYHIRGSTVHNAMKLGANQKLEYKPLPSSTLNTFRNQLGDIKLILIDEISMVGFKMFNCIHQRLQELKQSKEDFGGISIVVIGDLFQLKPVYDSYIFQQPNSLYMPLATSLWHEHFQMYELKQIMRQKESKEFALLLNRLREGQHTARDINSLNSRVVNPRGGDYPHEATHLFTTNQGVNLHNHSALHSGKQPVHE